jgi:hypothetical protein
MHKLLLGLAFLLTGCNGGGRWPETQKPSNSADWNRGAIIQPNCNCPQVASDYWAQEAKNRQLATLMNQRYKKP